MANVVRFTGGDGFLAIAERLEAMARRAKDVAPAWRAWGDDVAEAFRAQFLSEGVRLLHTVWAPLSPDYARWKARHFPGQTILRRTDTMMGEFERPMVIERVDSNSSEWGTNHKPAKFHQRGTRFMPARPIAQSTDDLKAAAAGHITRHITRGDLP